MLLNRCTSGDDYGRVLRTRRRIGLALAALGLLAVCCWLGKIGRNNKMFYLPMFFMLLVTLTSLVITIYNQVQGILGGVDTAWCWVRGIIAVLLVILSIVLVVEGVRALSQQKQKQANA